MHNNELLTSFNISNRLDLIYMLGKLDQEDYRKLFEIIIKNNNLDLAITLVQNIFYFKEQIQEILELSIKNINSFGIFNMLLNRCIISADTINIDIVRLLFYATEKGNTPVFFLLIKELLLDESFNIEDIINADGETLLMIATKNQHYDLVEFIVHFCKNNLNKTINQDYCEPNFFRSFSEIDYDIETKAELSEITKPSLSI